MWTSSNRAGSEWEMRAFAARLCGRIRDDRYRDVVDRGEIASRGAKFRGQTGREGWGWQAIVVKMGANGKTQDVGHIDGVYEPYAAEIIVAGNEVGSCMMNAVSITNTVVEILAKVTRCDWVSIFLAFELSGNFSQQ